MTVPTGSAQQAQIIQTSDGQAIVYPVQVDSQGNVLHQQSTGMFSHCKSHEALLLFTICFLCTVQVEIYQALNVIDINDERQYPTNSFFFSCANAFCHLLVLRLAGVVEKQLTC